MQEQLKTLIKKYNIIEKTKESFWSNFHSYRKEEAEEFEENFSEYQQEKLNVWLHSIHYGVKNWPECDYEYIVVRMEMEYNNKAVGKYEACYNMSGGYEDDYFVIY